MTSDSATPRLRTSATTARSEALFAEAQRHLPGGVDSPVRAFKSVGGTPRFIARGKGAYVWDADDNRYIDYLASWGPLIAGHAHPGVVAAIQDAATRGTSYGAPTQAEVDLAALIKQAFPSIDLLRFVNSGTEATMTALRLARAFTQRDLILKFDGGYHGHADGLLVQAGSGPLTLGQPDSPGVPSAAAHQTLSVPYNDLLAVKDAFAAHPRQIAAVIVEPVAGNMGVVPPEPGFLQHVRDMSAEEGTLLILDEVITGFRIALGGAQQRFGIRPDLTCLGKIVGGGLPVGAYGGRAEIMQQISPLGPVYQAGTLSGNPLAMAAGLATLHLLTEPGVYDHLERLASRLVDGLSRAAESEGVAYTSNRVGSMFTGFFTDLPVTDYVSAKQADTRRYARFFHALLDRGVYFAPSQFEAGFVSLAHTDEDIDATLNAAAAAFAEAKLLG
ncbi:MAG TPA: glutamate-1-semialdehyde 2,1-aminomutase [Chloroflexota bacterium]